MTLLAGLLLAVSLSGPEGAVVGLLNEARTDPRGFAERYLKARMKEGPEAAECYREMLRMKPRAPVRVSESLVKAARDHARQMGSRGALGHTGADGSTLRTRVERHGQWSGSIAENIHYGSDQPLRIVLDLLIDEGVTGRGHRRNILNPEMTRVGVALAPHRSYGFNCVMDFAAEAEP